MLNKYFIIFNNISSNDIGLNVTKRPSKPSPKKEYEEVIIPGKDGQLYRDKGYRDIEITIPFNFISKNPGMWDKDFRKVKAWLLKITDKKLIFSDDIEVFYKVKKISIETPERILKKIGKFNVVFTCDPYTYIANGADLIELNNTIFNYYLDSKPIYYIEGEGLLNITVNGKTVNVNVGQNITIDTELGLCFRSDGTINNIALEGKYEDLLLKEGENTFMYNTGFNINISTNWRCL